MKDAFPMGPLPNNLGDKLTAARAAEQQRQWAEREKCIAAIGNPASGMFGGVSDAIAGNQAQGIGHYAYQKHDHMKDFALQQAVQAAVDQALGLASGCSPEDVAVAVVKAYKAAKEELDKA